MGLLTQKAISGARWLTLSTIVATLLSLIQNVALGRMLDRRDVGLVGMLWAVLGLAQVFIDMGLSNAIVQNKHTSDKQLSAVYWVNLLAGCVVALLVYGAGPLIVSFYKEADLLPLVPWAALSFIALAVGQPFQAVSQKHLRFSVLAAADIAAGTVACTVAVLLAAHGFGAASMVFGSLTSAVARSLTLIAFTYKIFLPRLYWNTGEIREMLHFGYFQMADKIMNFAGSNLDYLLVGRFLGPEAVGVYRLAYETAVRPLSTINPIYNSVAYPIFSRQQDDNDSLRRGLLEGLRVVATIVFPLMAGLAMTADLIIPLMYGQKWAMVVPVLRILCILGALRSVINLAGSILLSKGLVKRSFWLNTLTVVLYAATYIWTARMGLVSLAWSANILLITIGVVTWHWIYGTTIGLDWRQYLLVLVKPACFSLLMAWLLYILIGLGWLAGPPVAALGCRVLVGALCYFTLLATFDRVNMRRIIGILLRR